MRNWITLALVLSFCGVFRHPSPERAHRTAPPALQLRLLQDDAQSIRPLFKIKLQNSSDRPLILDLGTNVGSKQYANEIKFWLTDETGKMRHLVCREPSIIAGTAGPYLLTILQGGTFQLPGIDLVNYWSYEPTVADLSLPAGRYRLSAEYTGHNPNDDLIPGQRPFALPEEVWIGSIHSNVVTFALSAALTTSDADQRPQ